MVKVAIVGSRGFNDYEYLCEVMDYLNAEGKVQEVVCGCARGADTLGEKWAKERGIPVKHFKPDWNRFGKGAGYLRNQEMADYADTVVAFWDEKSRGTKHMIDYSRKVGNDVRIKIGQKPWLKSKYD
jgi:hypothetical protein